jgi:hypothetical protein
MTPPVASRVPSTPTSRRLLRLCPGRWEGSIAAGCERPSARDAPPLAGQAVKLVGLLWTATGYAAKWQGQVEIALD